MVFHCFVLGESPSFPLGRGGSVLEPNSKNRDHFCGTEPNRNRNLRTKEPTVPNFCSYLKKILKFHRGKRKNTDFLSQFIKTFLQNLRFTLSLVGTEPNRNRKFWNRTEPEPKVLGPNRTGTENFGTDPPLPLGLIGNAPLRETAEIVYALGKRGRKEGKELLLCLFARAAKCS